MMNDEFESAFDRFLERQEYDEAESALFTIVRAAFLAGWKLIGYSLDILSAFLIHRRSPPRLYCRKYLFDPETATQ